MCTQKHVHKCLSMPKTWPTFFINEINMKFYEYWAYSCFILLCFSCKYDIIIEMMHFSGQSKLSAQKKKRKKDDSYIYWVIKLFPIYFQRDGFLYAVSYHLR